MLLQSTMLPDCANGVSHGKQAAGLSGGGGGGEQGQPALSTLMRDQMLGHVPPCDQPTSSSRSTTRFDSAGPGETAAAVHHMMNPPPSESEYSVDFSDVTYSGSESSVDTIQDILRRFTVDFQPDYTLKLRRSAGPLVLGVDLTQSTATKQQTLSAVLKPGDGGSAAAGPQPWWCQGWRRLKLDSQGLLTLRSGKLRMWLLTLDLEGHANLRTRTANMSFRLATKWDIARGHVRNKRVQALGESSEARLHWALDYNLPEVQGTVGAADTRVSHEVHTDIGYAHLSVPRIEVVYWPGSKRPSLRAAEQEAAEQQAEAGAVPVAAPSALELESQLQQQQQQQADVASLAEHSHASSAAEGSGSLAAAGTAGGAAAEAAGHARAPLASMSSSSSSPVSWLPWGRPASRQRRQAGRLQPEGLSAPACLSLSFLAAFDATAPAAGALTGRRRQLRA